MLNYVLMFIVSFAVELCGVAYTIAIARGKDHWVVIFSALNSILAWGLILFVVYDTQLFPAAIIGDVCGTATAMKLSKYRNRG